MLNLFSKIFFIAAIFMIIISLSLPFFFDNPRDTLNITSSEFIVRKSGFPPIIYFALKFATLIIYISFCVLYFYIDKLIKAPDFAKRFFRLRRCVFLIYYLLFPIAFLLIIQLLFCIIALLRIPNVQLADIIHSSLPVYSACLFGVFGFFPLYYFLKSAIVFQRI